MARNPASFRDPSGYVIDGGDSVYRAVSPFYKDEWQSLANSGFLDKAIEAGLLPFEILPPGQWPGEADGAFAVLKSPKLPFISWPYEWSFSQLKAAALLTLDLQKLALENGFILKDATAYNIQFWNGKPVFIDLLSFERLRPGRPWDAYRQFCQHFLAPLALMSQVDERLGALSKNWIDGIPLDLASSMLPLKSKLSPGLAMHIHMHAKMQARHAETGEKAIESKETKINARQLQDIAASLKRTVESLSPPARKTEWGDYYSDTNYTQAAAEAKRREIARLAAAHPGKLAIDLGANNGEFSQLLAPHFEQVLATDIDHAAVDQHWSQPKAANILPLVLDLANPSPASGWNCQERPSFQDRCQADFVSALALVHHLRITAGIPVVEIISGFKNLLKPGGTLVVEFVPKSDSQVKRLLSRRDDIFADYSLEPFLAAAADAGLEHLETAALPETERTLLVFRRPDDMAR